MSRSIQILAIIFLAAAACAPDAGPAYRGNDGRTGEFSSPGPAELDQIKWKVRLSAPIAGPVALHRETAYVLAENGTLSALDITDGGERWKLDLETPAFGAPIVAGQRLIVGTDVGLVAVGFDGTEQWRLEGSPVEAPPIVFDSVAYAGDLDGNVKAVDVVGGSLIWKAVTAGPIRTAPVLADGSVIVGSGDGGVYSLDPASGEPRWAWSAPAAVRGLSASSQRVFVCAGSEVIAIDLAEPEASAWRADVGAIVETPPSLSGGMVVVGTGAGSVTGLDRTDGSQLFEASLDAAVHGDIAVMGDRLAVPTARRGVEVRDRAGNELWSFRTDGNVAGVTPLDERLFVTDSAGSVYALE